MDRDEVEVHKHAKKEQGQYPAILTEQPSNLARLSSQSQREIWFILPTRGASRIINCIISIIVGQPRTVLLTANQSDSLISAPEYHLAD